jgi:hypothetical protein
VDHLCSRFGPRLSVAVEPLSSGWLPNSMLEPSECCQDPYARKPVCDEAVDERTPKHDGVQHRRRRAAMTAVTRPIIAAAVRKTRQRGPREP